MAFGGGHHVFRAVVNNLDWFAGLPRQQRRVTGNQRWIFFLAAKAAAGFSLNDADLVFRQVKQLYERFVNVVRTLHRTPNRYAFVRIGDRNRAVVLDVELLLRAGVVFAFDDEIRAGPGFVDVAFIDQKLLEDIVFAPDDLLLRE